MVTKTPPNKLQLNYLQKASAAASLLLFLFFTQGNDVLILLDLRYVMARVRNPMLTYISSVRVYIRVNLLICMLVCCPGCVITDRN